MIDRRSALLGLGAASLAHSPVSAAQSAANGWFPLRGDDGSPVPNGRAPVELVDEVEDMPGVLWGGGGTAPAVTLIEFYDYNCPWCRRSAADLDRLMRDNGDLRIGLVNNPILSPASLQAAKVHLAVLDLSGPALAHGLHTQLLASPGTIDGTRALEGAAALGADRAAVESKADSEPIRRLLRRQMSLAASLGLRATPSFVVGGATILGYPGSNTLSRIVADARTCGTVTCQTGN